MLGALFQLVAKNRRRYGGYIVHLGIVGMFIGFVGSAWTLEREVSMLPGQSHEIGGFKLTYLGTRMCPGSAGKCSAAEQADLNKRMLFADFEVSRGDAALGKVSPAKFFYHKSPDGPTTEVALLRSLREDLYTVIGTVDPQSKRGTFRFHVNPLVSWIWLGCLLLIFGASISLWPELALGELGAWSYVRAGAGAAAATALAVWLAMSPNYAYASVKPPPADPPAARPPKLDSHRLLAPATAALFGLGVGAFFTSRRRRHDGVTES